MSLTAARLRLTVATAQESAAETTRSSLENDSRYVFICYVNAYQMADEIVAAFTYSKGGEVKTITDNYSVKAYIEAFESALANNENAFDEKTVALVRALADYGHYIQPYLMDVRGWTFTDHLEMDKYYTGSDGASGYDCDSVLSAINNGEYNFSKSISNEAFTKITYSLTFDDDTIINAYFTPQENYTGAFAVKLGENGEAVVLDGSSTTASGVSGGKQVTVAKQSDGRYKVSVAGIKAYDLDTMYTIIASTDAGAATVQVSGYSYIRSWLAKGDAAYDDPEKTAHVRNALAAIYYYSRAAKTYIGGNT